MFRVFRAGTLCPEKDCQPEGFFCDVVSSVMWFQMRIGIVFAALCFVLMAGPVRADQTDPLLDSLFEALAQNDDPNEAIAIEQRIRRIWRETGSPSIDLLMTRASLAIDRQEYELALRHLNDVVELAPDYAEGWFGRASVYYFTDRYDQAVLDFDHVLQLERNHFGAWASLGQIYLEIGKNAQALSTFRRALEVNPFLKGMAEKVKRLEKQVEGQGI